jgi:hypothetical protein
MATDTLSGFKFYYGNKTMVLNDDWTFLYNNQDITNTISSVGSNLSGIISSTSNFQNTLSGVKQNVVSMSGTYYTFDNSIRSSVSNLGQHTNNKLVDISSSLVTIQSQAISNLSNNIQSSIQTLSGQIKTLKDQPPAASAGFSYSSLTQNNDSLVINDGYNFNITDGNLSLEESYTTPVLKPSTTSYMTTQTYTTSTSVFHTSPSSASFSGNQRLTLTGHGADLTTRAFWTIEFFFNLSALQDYKNLLVIQTVLSPYVSYMDIQTSSGKLYYKLGNGGNQFSNASLGITSLSTNTWYHLAVQATKYDQIDYYLNGIKDCTFNVSLGNLNINPVMNSIDLGGNSSINFSEYAANISKVWWGSVRDVSGRDCTASFTNFIKNSAGSITLQPFTSVTLNTSTLGSPDPQPGVTKYTWITYITASGTEVTLPSSVGNGYADGTSFSLSNIPISGQTAITGYIDSIRMSCTPRYSGSSYTIPTAPYTLDPFTTYLNYFDTNPSFTNYVDTTPMNYSGIHVWFDANDSSTMTLSGSTLNTWTDRSGNGRNAIVNQTAPTFSLSGFNSSKPGLVFSTGNSLRCTSPVGSFNNGVSMFVVFSKTVNGGAYETLLTKTIGGSLAAPWEFWGPGRHVGNGGAFINYTNAGTNIRSARGANIFSAMLDTNSWAEYCNGSGVTSTNFFYRMEDAGSLLHIGTRADGATSFTGCISEIIVYNRTLNNTERSEIETYLSNKWNVTMYNNKGQYCYTPTLTNINSGSLTLTKFKGLSNPTLQVNNSGVVILSTSDENLKKDISSISNSLEKIKMITPVEFDWKDYPSHDYGFTAQDIRENLDPNMVYNVDEQEHLGFDTIKLIPFLTKAIQELDHQINELLER